jgi:hypothetical protein
MDINMSIFLKEDISSEIKRAKRILKSLDYYVGDVSAQDLVK